MYFVMTIQVSNAVGDIGRNQIFHLQSKHSIDYLTDQNKDSPGAWYLQNGEYALLEYLNYPPGNPTAINNPNHLNIAMTLGA
jgi:hypothetical protein